MNEFISTAKSNLQSKYNILYPELASVSLREFDPCKAVQVIATVSMPAIINAKEIILSHSICDGDQIYP